MYRIIPKKITEKTISLPSSKSISHRILILAGLNYGKTRIRNLLSAEDTDITLRALQNMGLESGEEEGALLVHRPIGKVSEEKIYLGNSGSSARFLLPLPAYGDKPVYFYGKPRLHQRPFEALFSALEQLGIRFKSGQNTLPAQIFPGEVSGGSIRLETLPSSQFVTALMLSALWMKNDLQLQLPENIPSAPYIKMTGKLMKHLGMVVEYSAKGINVQAEKPELEWNFSVEKDLSAASYWVVSGLIHGARITLPGITLPSLQGDERIFAIAEEAGAEVMLYPDRVEISGGIKRGLRINCRDIPDLVPALSILGLFSPESIQLMNVAHLQYKESNRIEAILQNIATLGGKSEFSEGHLTIFPQKAYHGGLIHSFNDHRIAMSFAAAGSKIDGVVINNPHCVKKSYPNFWEDFSNWENISDD
jgi:3-phosphoshikimate 1-carboxyvinyltransferase